MDDLTDMTSDVDVLSRQYQIRSNAIVPRASQDAPTMLELSRIRELHLGIWQIVKERDELRARIAELENKGIDQLEFMLQQRIAELEAMIDSDSEDYGIVANAAGWALIKKLKAPPSEREIEAVAEQIRGASSFERKKYTDYKVNYGDSLCYAKAAIETYQEGRR